MRLPTGTVTTPTLSDTGLSISTAARTWLCSLRYHSTGVPVVVQQKRIRLGTMRLWVQSLASLSGFRIWHFREQWCRLQMRLESCVAVVVA